jgi:hypothetical protein
LLRPIIFEEKEKTKKKKKNASFFGSGGMKTSFLAKKYYPTFKDDLLTERRIGSTHKIKVR